jgi:glycosyltransferase involved in cell wall biosynthesis
MQPTPQTLVLITPGFAASEADSTCLPLQQALVRAWLAREPGLRIVVIALHYPYHVDGYTLFGAHVQPFNGHNKGGLHRWRRAHGVKLFLQNLQEASPIAGIVSCWYGECAALGASFAAKWSLPHYCWILGQDARPGNQWPERIQLPAESLVALSPFLQNSFEKNYACRPALIIEPGLEEVHLNEGPRDIDLLAVGSFIPLKNYPVFIRLVDALRQVFPNLRAVLAGSGPGEASLKAMAVQLGLGMHLHFAGELSHIKVRELMGKARLFIHPSTYEGYSGVCQEAVSAGTRVLSFCAPSDTPAECWTIVDGEAEMMAMAQNLLLDQKPFCAESFSIDKTAEQWLSLFFQDQRKPVMDANLHAMDSNERV